MIGRNKSLEQELYKRARKRVKIKRAFKLHRNIYIVTSICFILMMGLIGIFEDELAETLLAAMIFAITWGIAVGIHFVCAGARLKALDIDNEIEKEIQYLKQRAGMDFINEPLNADVYNMKNVNVDKSLDKKV